MTAPGLDLFPIGLVVRELRVGEQGKVLVEYSFALLVLIGRFSFVANRFR